MRKSLTPTLSGRPKPVEHVIVVIAIVLLSCLAGGLDAKVIGHQDSAYVALKQAYADAWTLPQPIK